MCVYGSVYLCAFVRICVCMGVCAFGHTRTHAQTRTCTRLNASLGNCLNGIRGDYGSCWGDGTVGMTWENTHVAFTAQTAMLLVDSKQRWLCGDSLYPKDTSGPWLLCKLARKRYDTPFGRVETCKTKYSNNESVRWFVVHVLDCIVLVKYEIIFLLLIISHAAKLGVSRGDWMNITENWRWMSGGLEVGTCIAKFWPAEVICGIMLGLLSLLFSIFLTFSLL